MEKITNQHGDLILKQIEQIPPTAVKLEGISGSYVLLKGEGVNTHELLWQEQGVQIFMDGEKVYLEIPSPIKLTHLEHGVQTVNPGTYERVIEREFDYEEMEARNVRD